METRLSNIFKTTNVTNLTKVILESFYRVLQVISKWKKLKQPVYFLQAVEFCPTFRIHINITSAIFREKLQNHTFQKAHRSLSKQANIPITRATHYEIVEITGRRSCYFISLNIVITSIRKKQQTRQYNILKAALKKYVC